MQLRRIFAISFLLCFVAQAGFAQDKLRVMLKAPAGGTNASTAGADTKLFEHSVAIPYGVLEGQISSAISSLVNSKGDLSGSISKAGIDYDYSINSSATFSFTQANQPVLTVLSSSQNKVRVQLNAAARVVFKADLLATTDDHIPAPPFIEYPDFDGSIKVHADFQISAKADVTLWPVVVVENVTTSLTSDAPHVEVKDLAGDMTGFAIGVGTAVGFSPGGLIMGGPAAFSLVGLLGSNAAYDYAVDQLDKKLFAALEGGVAKANDQLESQLMKYVAPAVAGVNQVKTAALNKTIPGYGVSVSQLQSQAGVSLDVRTLQSQGITVWATVRFDGNPRNGKVTGVIKFPKKKCHKAGGSVAGQTIVIGLFEETNADLAQGMSCSALINGSGMQVKAFLGPTPPTTSLANWKSATSGLAGIGTIKDVSTGASEGYYECKIEMTGLPNGLLRLTPAGSVATRLDEYGNDPQLQLVLGQSGGAEFGGPGKCDGTGSSGGLTPSRVKELKDKIDCPHCPQVQLDRSHEVINPGVLRPGRALKGQDRVIRPGQKMNPNLPAGETMKTRSNTKTRRGKGVVEKKGYGGPNASPKAGAESTPKAVKMNEAGKKQGVLRKGAAGEGADEGVQAPKASPRVGH